MNTGRQFGPYRLIRRIAVGGMAEIHLAKTAGIAGFEKYVAIKMIHPNFSQDENFVEMLIDEAKISVQLQHVNIAQTFDLGRVGDTYYITMEYVDGADLYQLLRKASEREIDMPVDVAAFIAKEMANGLDYAHRRRGVDGQPLGIVHRDVSPQNVLVSHAGEVKLVDFGIAKATMKVRQTAVGVIKGKYYYMSPEQAWGDVVDHRTDIFSAGILLYESLTGQMLYLEEDLHQLLDMVRKANIPPPTRLRRDIPPQLEKIVMHALAKRREDRYQTAGDLATDLERFLHVYSPVFRATKVQKYFETVLPAEPPPPTVGNRDRVEVLVAKPPSTVTGRIAQKELLRERSEFSDENSVIFRMSDLEAQERAQQKPRKPRGAQDSTKPIPPTAPTNSIVEHLENIEEQTMISAPPGFSGERTEEFGDADFEPTLVGEDEFDDMDGQVTEADPESLRRALAAQTKKRRGDSVTSPLPQPPPMTGRKPPARKPPARKPPGRGAEHPAKAASSPMPAISQVHKPRQSRRTPGKGVPTPGPSLISSLVGTGDVPPVRRDPVAERSPEGQPPGFPLQAPPATPIPGPAGLPSSLAANQVADPFSPLPSGPKPLTLTKQLAAIELEEIPDQFKLGKRKPRWVLWASLAGLVVCAGVGVAAFSGGDKQRDVILNIRSNPEGATVRIDGTRLSQTTPVRYTSADMGASYELEFELDGYTSRKKKVIIDAEEDEVMVFLEQEIATVTLIVESQPPGAQIVIGQDSHGSAPKRITGLDPRQATTLELRLEGYKLHRETLDWKQRAEQTRKIELRQQ